MKNKLLYLFITLLILNLPTSVYSQLQRECDRKYQVSGTNKLGAPVSFEVALKEKCYDFTKKEVDERIKFEKSNTYGDGYTLISNPTRKTNCAGLGMYRLFGTGPFNFNTDEFDNLIISNFGKEVYKPGDVTWSGVKDGDIVVYRNDKGKPKHVAIVNSVDYSGLNITIESKCNDEGTYLHPMGILYLSENDPLIQSNGKPYIYQIDISQIKIEPLGDKCSCPPELAGGWYCLLTSANTEGPCTIEQDFDKLTFINENGGASAGYLTVGSDGKVTVFATDWKISGSLDNDLKTLSWSNNTTWIRK